MRGGGAEIWSKARRMGRSGSRQRSGLTRCGLMRGGGGRDLV
jgi:hypothetical protein